MLARHAVLLTLPSDCNRPSWSYHHTGTLPRLISFVSHSYANTGGGGYSSHFGTRQSTAVMRTRRIAQVLSFHILAHSFALFCILKELNSLLFNRFRTLCPKTPGVWGYSSYSGTPVLTTLSVFTFNFQLSTFPS